MKKVSAGSVLDEQPEAGHEQDLYGNQLSTEYAADLSSVGDDDIDAFFERGYIAFERAFSPAEVRDALSLCAAADMCNDAWNTEHYQLSNDCEDFKLYASSNRKK